LSVRLSSALRGVAFLVLLNACSDLDPIVGPRIVASSGDGTPQSDGGVKSARDGGISFREQLRPILDRAPKDAINGRGKGCKNCHDSSEASHVGIDFGGFDSGTLGALREGGGSTGRRIIVPGRPDQSAFIQKLTGKYPIGARMPKNGPPFLGDDEIELFSQWIREGALGDNDE